MRAFMFMLVAMMVYTGATVPAHAFGNNWGGFAGESSRPSQKSDGAFAQGEALRNGTFYEGEVVAARQVTLEGRYGETTGRVAGGTLGALAGSHVGKGNGRYVGGLVGGLIGASLGGPVGRAVSEDRATELFVKLGDGRNVVIVQQMDREVRRGDKVFVTRSSGNNFRVVQMAGAM